METPHVLIGVDTYSYHRQLGELRPTETAPPRYWSHEELIEAILAADVEVASLETCFLPDLGFVSLSRTVTRLREAAVEPVVAWGHPDGLAGGRRTDALAELEGLLVILAELEVGLLRIVVGSPRQWRTERESTMVRRLIPQLRGLVARAEELGVHLAVETHGELSLPSFAAMVTAVRGLGVVLDTGNVIRVGGRLEDAVSLLGPRVSMVHAKDLSLRGVTPATHPADPWYCVPVGSGALPLEETLAHLVASGFDGPVCVELMELDPEVAGDEIAAVRESVRTLRDWREQLSRHNSAVERGDGVHVARRT